MKLRLITETSHEILAEEKGKDLYVMGIFSSANRRNNNQRVYQKDTLVREVKGINEKMERKALWGELGHPPNPEINPDKIAIMIETLEWKGDELYGKAKVLDTPMGNIAKTLIKEGNLGISSRGLGTVGEGGKVNEDFNLITYDLVTDPSNGPSWVNGIFEGKTFGVTSDDTVENAVEEELTREQAQDEYKKHLWQVLETIKKSL